MKKEKGGENVTGLAAMAALLREGREEEIKKQSENSSDLKDLDTSNSKRPLLDREEEYKENDETRIDDVAAKTENNT